MFTYELAVALVDDSFIFSTQTESKPLIVPAYIAVTADSNRVLTVGEDARKMVGRAPKNIQIVRILRNGAPVEDELATALFRHSLRQIRSGMFQPRPKVVMAIRPDIPTKTLAKNMALFAGAAEISLIEMGMATAIGMKLPVQEPNLKAVLSISEDWFEFSVISLSGVLLRVAGDTGSESFIEDIQNHLSLARQFRPEAAAIRSLLMTAGVEPSEATNIPGWEVWRGRSEQGRMAAEPISQSDLTTGMAPSLNRITERIKSAIRSLTPEQQYQLSDSGIRATGSAMRIPGLPEAIAQHLGYKVIPHKSAHHPAIEGAKSAITEIKFLRKIERFAK